MNWTHLVIYQKLSSFDPCSDNIFGGFTEKAWNSSCQYVADRNAFVFSLVNKENNPLKVMCEENCAIRCFSSRGPSFGCGDIIIVSDSNLNRESFSYFGNSYKHFFFLKKFIYSKLKMLLM